MYNDKYYSVTERDKFDHNEFLFYYFMPDSEIKENELGYFLKNDAIETYSYVTPKNYGVINFEEFLSYSFSYFGNGTIYFVLKIPYDNYYLNNSNILRKKRFLISYSDVNVMAWNKGSIGKLKTNEALRVDKLNYDDLYRWVDVFFDSFRYPKNLREYISRMVEKQYLNGISFFVGKVSNKDVSCFCSNITEDLIGIYGVGTKTKFQRRGYAQAMLSNYIDDIIKKDENKSFCLQTNKNSGAEKLYKKIGFTSVYIQKRFEWNPDIIK